MAENSDGQERSEAATPKREREAREKGQVARSKELSTVVALLVAATAFLSMGDSLLAGMAELLKHSFTISRAEVFDPASMSRALGKTIFEALWLFMPFFVLMIIAGVAASVVISGWSFSAKSLEFKWEKLDPIKGMGKLFAWRGLVEMLKGLAKFLLVAAVALLLLKLQGAQYLGLGNESLEQGLAHAGHLLTWALLFLSAVLLIVAAIDVPFQLWDHRQQLKMTKEEVREERKQTDGSPEVKGRQRRLQIEMAQRRMMEEVPKADVVVTNPTHYAVALRYSATEMGAPIVVAKGTELVASRIRALAEENEVPVLSAPPLARALYFSTELNEAIPEGLYRAVAQVLAYVYQLKQNPGYGRRDMAPLDNLPIPDELRRDGPNGSNEGN